MSKKEILHTIYISLLGQIETSVEIMLVLTFFLGTGSRQDITVFYHPSLTPSFLTVTIRENTQWNVLENQEGTAAPTALPVL